jgi:hypothetical protein
MVLYITKAADFDRGYRASLMHVISAQKKRFQINALGFVH